MPDSPVQAASGIAADVAKVDADVKKVEGDLASGASSAASDVATETSAVVGDLVKVRVAWPTSVFKHGVEGVEDLSSKVATEVSRVKLPALEAAAKQAAVKLITEEV